MKHIVSRIVLLLVILGAYLTACASSTPSLAVSAAADLQTAFGEMGAAFQKETGTQIDFNFGSTGQLAQQITQGAPVDVFASADRATVNDLASRGLLLQDTVHVFARGAIVLYVKGDSPHQVSSLEDLTRSEMKRIAIANPEHAPYGRAAREALETKGLWQVVQPKIIFAENIQQTLQYADTGNVDLAIVALSLAFTSKGRWTEIPQDLYRPIDQSLAVVKGTKNASQARAFEAFVVGAKGRAVLSKYGYGLPP